MNQPPRLVVVESPYAARKGDQWDPEGVEENLRYLRAALHDCLKRGEAPYASHALYTQLGVLNDEIPEERKQGIEAGFAWNRQAEVSVFYVDKGISSGMRQGIKNAVEANRPIEIRNLPEFAAEPMVALERTQLMKAAIGEAYLVVAEERRKEREEWSRDIA